MEPEKILNAERFMVYWIINELEERNNDWRGVRQNYIPRPSQRNRFHLPRTKVRF